MIRRQFQLIDNRQMDNLRVFHEVARALTSNLELEALLRTIMSKMEEFFGPERWSLLMVDEERGELYYALTSGIDALQNATHVKLIHHLSITDDFTGLFNARHLYQMVEEEIAKSCKSGTHFSLLFFDLDYFKNINDTHGHLAGSRLLAEVGSLVKRALGPGHAGFRYGGDEFVALLPGLDRSTALEMAQAVRDSLNRTPFLTDEGLSIRITASFGLATYPENGNTLHGMIRAADSAMYCSKEQGRDRISVTSGSQTADLPLRRTSRHGDPIA